MLLKNNTFLIFLVCAFLVSIPANNYYWPGLVSFLTDRGYPAPVALTTINQFSEILFMVALAFCIPRIGLKNVILIGMAAWSLRWFCFSMPYFETAMLGLLLHGFCFAFLYIASYMYADKVAPDNLKASAQSLMVFLLIGVAQLIGGQWFGAARDAEANQPQHTTIVVQGEDRPIPAWNDEETWLQNLDLAAHVRRIRGVVETPQPHLGTLLPGGQPLTREAIAGMDEAALQQLGVDAESLTRFGEMIAEVAEGAQFSITREEWLAAQSRNWAAIYRVPAIFIAVFFVIFLILGREPKDAITESKS